MAFRQFTATLLIMLTFGCTSGGSARPSPERPALDDYAQRTGIDAAELDRRNALQGRYSSINAQVAAEPNQFGTSYYAEFPDGTYGLTITYVGQDPPQVANPDNLPLRFERVPYSRAQLETAAFAISKRMVELEIYSIGAANATNRIIITTADPERAARELSSYGDMLRIQKGEPLSHP
jgi:hypothetical protein